MLPDWVSVDGLPPAVESLLRRLGAVMGLDPAVVALGLFAVVVLLIAVVRWRWRRTGAGASKRAHERAREREPPVELGETYEFGVREFTDHHSGTRVAVGKVEGFVLFTADVPEHVDQGEVIRARVLSFNRGQTSADATYVDTA